MVETLQIYRTLLNDFRAASLANLVYCYMHQMTMYVEIKL